MCVCGPLTKDQYGSHTIFLPILSKEIVQFDFQQTFFLSLLCQVLIDTGNSAVNKTRRGKQTMSKAIICVVKEATGNH